MRKAEVFQAEQNPACDRPSYRPLLELQNLVRLKRAVQIGPRSFHLIPLHEVFQARTGYDRAVQDGAASEMIEVWTIRESAGVGVWQMNR
jgi:hypothetical protein